MASWSPYWVDGFPSIPSSELHDQHAVKAVLNIAGKVFLAHRLSLIEFADITDVPLSKGSDSDGGLDGLRLTRKERGESRWASWADLMKRVREGWTGQRCHHPNTPPCHHS